MKTVAIPAEDIVCSVVGSPPSIDDLAMSLRQKSLWLKHDSIASVVQAEAHKNTPVTANHYVEWENVPHPIHPVAPQSSSPEIKKKKKGPKIDHSKLAGEDRWDFLG
jgi:hypothetical protein